MKTKATSALFTSSRTLSLGALALAALLPLSGCATTQSSPSVAQGASCGSLTGGDEVLSAFYAPGAIYEARPVKEKIFKARALQPVETRGASLYVKATPEMNSPYLQRVLSCHAASSSDAHPNDPLHPSQGSIASLEVSEARHGFRVDVLAENQTVGTEIWKRAEALSHQKGSVEVKQVGGLSDLNQAF